MSDTKEEESRSSNLVGDDTVLHPTGSIPIDPLKYKLDRAPDSPVHYNLRTVSYSGLLTLHSCPRRFELNRLLQKGYDPDVDEDAAGHLDYGTIVGNGIQELLISGDMNKAYFTAFLSWNDNLESERGAKSKKTFWHALEAISNFQEIMYGPLSQYDLASYMGRPATELGFAIDCGDGFTYRGKLDALTIHSIKREFLPLECKTTGWKYLDEAMYGNSSQGIGYGVVIDRVAHEMSVEYNSYDVFYPVYMTSKAEWVPFRFHKTNTARALWLQSVLFDIEDIRRYSEAEYFPQRGESCFSYGRQCRHYGTCHMSNEILIGDLKSVPVKLDKIGEFPMEFTIEELVEAQVEKQDKENENG